MSLQKNLVHFSSLSFDLSSVFVGLMRKIQRVNLRKSNLIVTVNIIFCNSCSSFRYRKANSQINFDSWLLTANLEPLQSNYATAQHTCWTAFRHDKAMESWSFMNNLWELLLAVVFGFISFFTVLGRYLWE